MARPYRRSTTATLVAAGVALLMAVSCLSGSPTAGFWFRHLLGLDLATAAAPQDPPRTGATGLAAAGSPSARASAQATGTKSTKSTGKKKKPVRTSPPPTLLKGRKIEVSFTGYWSWALLETATGKISGSSRPTAVSDTASMIKVWIAADFLRRAAEAHTRPPASELEALSLMIRDSDNAHANELHEANGDLDSIQRMVRTCALTETIGTKGYWSLTYMSARDIARLGACLTSGTAAGSVWTPWLLNEMRNVRGEGYFGVVTVLPGTEADNVAIKNGWLIRDDDQQWHISCLAAGDGWSLGVQARYASTLGKEYGEGICREIGRRLMG